MKNIRILIGISIFTLVLLGCLSQSITAGECDYGSMYAWYSKDGVTWENATAHPTLKLGEEFFIKTSVASKTELLVMSMRLHEFGTPVFEVINGASEIEERLECARDLDPEDNFTYIWELRVRPNTTWTNAYAPLEVLSQFNIDSEYDCTVSFDVIAAYIEDELWEGYTGDSDTTPENGNETPGTPGFELLFAICAMAIIFLLKRRQMH